MTATDQIKAQLEQRLAELGNRADAIENDLRSALAADSEEQATELADDEALAEIDAVLHREMSEIRAALLRIEQGTYGFCTSCGAIIGQARLQALPTAIRCIACA